MGTSGSGKTTIAGLAASFLKPDSGVIQLDGVNLATIKLNSYRSKLGVVLQDDFLFEGTIRENILFPRPDANEEEISAAVQAAHVKEFTDRFEDGLDTLIGERNTKERQGAVGHFTNGVMDRKAYYVAGLVVALIPFLNPDLYFESIKNHEISQP